MAFGFDDIFAALQTAYATATGESVPFVSGEQERHKHENLPPRVIFLHRGGSHEAPGQVDATSNARDTQPTRSIAVEVLRAECHAVTDDDAYELWESVCALLKQQYGDAVILGTFGWLTQEERTASPCLGWSVKWQDIRFRTPVRSPLRPTTEVLTTGHECFLAESLDQDPLPTGCEHDEDEEPTP